MMGLGESPGSFFVQTGEGNKIRGQGANGKGQVASGKLPNQPNYPINSFTQSTQSTQLPNY
jgi:hypothetical protein